MLTETTLERLSEAGRPDQLIDALAHNGLPLPLPLRVRLADRPAAVAALTLRRMVQLTYGPTGASRALTARLLRDQAPAGAWDGDALTTAAAVAALARVTREHRSDGGIDPAIHRGLHALAGLQAGDGGFGRPQDGDRELVTLLVLYLIGENPDHLGAIRLADLMGYLEARVDGLRGEAATLWEVARLTARPDRVLRESHADGSSLTTGLWAGRGADAGGSGSNSAASRGRGRSGTGRARVGGLASGSGVRRSRTDEPPPRGRPGAELGRRDSRSIQPGLTQGAHEIASGSEACEPVDAPADGLMQPHRSFGGPDGDPNGGSGEAGVACPAPHRRAG